MIDRDLQRPGMSDIRRHILVARSGNQRTTMTPSQYAVHEQLTSTAVALHGAIGY